MEQSELLSHRRKEPEQKREIFALRFVVAVLVVTVVTLSIIIGVLRADTTSPGDGESQGSGSLPLVLNTWGFTNATQKAYSILTAPNGTILDAVVGGVTVCEVEQCDGTVGRWISRVILAPSSL
jgi:hypothetical protein